MPVLYATLEIGKIQVLSLLSTLFVLVGVNVLYQINIFDINLVVSLVGLGNIIVLALLIFFLREAIVLKIPIDLSLLKDLFFYGVKLSVTNLVFLLSSNIVIFLLKILLDKGFESVGLFSRATAVANIFILIPTSVGPLLYSKWSRIATKNLHFEVEKTLRILFFFSLTCVGGIFLFGEAILLLLYGKDFLPAKSALDVLSISLVFSSITIVITNLFSSVGKPMITLKVFFVSLLVTSLFSVVFIPKLNILGAAISVLAGIVFNSVFLLYWAKREIGLNFFSSFILQKGDIDWFKKSLLAKKA